MLARVRSQIRRYTKLGGSASSACNDIISIGGILLNDASKTVTVDGDTVIGGIKCDFDIVAETEPSSSNISVFN